MDTVDIVDTIDPLDPMGLMDPSKWLDPDLDKKMHRNIDLRPFLNTFWESLRNQISRAPQLEPPTWHPRHRSTTKTIVFFGP